MIIDSINEALSRGASPDSIVQKIKQSNPNKAASFDEAVKRGANSKMILDQIIKQNTVKTEKSFGDKLADRVANDEVMNPKSVTLLNAIPQVGVGIGKTFGDIASTPFKKASLIEETLGAKSLAQESSKGMEELTRQSNALNAKYLSLKAGDPLKKQILDDIKRTQKAINDIGKGLVGEGDVGSVTKKRFSLLESANSAQSVGKFVGDVIALIAGGKANYSGITSQITSKAPLIGKITRTADELSKLNKSGELNRLGSLANKAVELTKSYLTGAAKFAPITASTGDGDLKEIATDASTAGIFNAAGTVFSGLKKVLPKTAEKLEEWNLRLTPGQRAAYGDKIKRVTNFLTRSRYQGTPTMRYNSVSKDYEKMENIIEGTLANSKEAGLLVKGKNIIDSLIVEGGLAAKNNSEGRKVTVEFMGAIKNLFEQYGDDSFKQLSNKTRSTFVEKLYNGVTELNSGKKSLDSQYRAFISSYKNMKINVDDLNQLKRSAFSNAVNETGLDVLNDVRFKIAHKYYDGLTETLESAGVKILGKNIKEFNREYQDLINARTLLRASQFRNQVGTFNRLVAGMSGILAGSSMFESAYKGTIAHTVLNSVATPSRAAIAKLLMMADDVGIENLPKEVAQLVMYLRTAK